MLLFILTHQAATPACAPPPDRERVLALSYAAFDGAPPPHGWRALNAAGCADEARRLLTDYAARNQARLSPEQARAFVSHRPGLGIRRPV